MPPIKLAGLPDSNIAKELEGHLHGASDGPLKQLDIHVSPRFDTTWL